MKPEDLIDLGILVFVVGMRAGVVVIGGGWSALRRQWSQFALITVLVVGVLLATRWIDARGAGDLLSLVTLPLTIVVIYLIYRRFARSSPSEREFRRKQLNRPVVWAWVGIFVVAGLVLPFVILALAR